MGRGIFITFFIQVMIIGQAFSSENAAVDFVKKVEGNQFTPGVNVKCNNGVVVEEKRPVIKVAAATKEDYECDELRKEFIEVRDGAKYLTLKTCAEIAAALQKEKASEKVIVASGNQKTDQAEKRVGEVGEEFSPVEDKKVEVAASPKIQSKGLTFSGKNKGAVGGKTEPTFRRNAFASGTQRGVASVNGNKTSENENQNKVQGKSTSTDIDYNEALRVTNEVRSKKGVSPIVISEGLNQCAQNFADKMCERSNACKNEWDGSENHTFYKTVKTQAELKVGQFFQLANDPKMPSHIKEYYQKKINSDYKGLSLEQAINKEINTVKNNRSSKCNDFFWSHSFEGKDKLCGIQFSENITRSNNVGAEKASSYGFGTSHESPAHVINLTKSELKSFGVGSAKSCGYHVHLYSVNGPVGRQNENIASGKNKDKKSQNQAQNNSINIGVQTASNNVQGQASNASNGSSDSSIFRNEESGSDSVPNRHATSSFKYRVQEKNTIFHRIGRFLTGKGFKSNPKARAYNQSEPVRRPSNSGIFRGTNSWGKKNQNQNVEDIPNSVDAFMNYPTREEVQEIEAKSQESEAENETNNTKQGFFARLFGGSGNRNSSGGGIGNNGSRRKRTTSRRPSSNGGGMGRGGRVLWPEYSNHPDIQKTIATSKANATYCHTPPTSSSLRAMYNSSCPNGTKGKKNPSGSTGWCAKYTKAALCQTLGGKGSFNSCTKNALVSSRPGGDYAVHLPSNLPGFVNLKTACPGKVNEFNAPVGSVIVRNFSAGGTNYGHAEIKTGPNEKISDFKTAIGSDQAFAIMVKDSLMPEGWRNKPPCK